MLALFDGDPSSPTFGTQVRVLANPDPRSQDFFGYSVATVGTNILVGAPNNDTGATNAGIAYLFDGNRSSPTFGQFLATFPNPDPDAGDEFGYDVSALGNTALIGTADGEAAYQFEANLSSPRFGQLLRTFANPAPPAAGDPSDGFGRAVASFGSLVVVGAPDDDDTASGTVTNAGAAYVFNGETGALVETIFNPTPRPGDAFGFAVMGSGIGIVIGSIRDDAGGGTTTTDNGGAAYVAYLGVDGLTILSDDNQVFGLNI